MKTNMRRCLVIVLTISTLLAMAACPTDGDPGNQDVSVRGANITVASWGTDFKHPTYNVETFEAGNFDEERYLNYRTNLLRDEGFTFQVVELSKLNDYLPMVIDNIIAGNKTYQIYEVSAAMAFTLYKQGLLYPVGDSSAVNFNNRQPVAYRVPMYNVLVQDFMTLGGKTYGWHYGLPNDTWGQGMVFFNIDHLTAIGLSSGYIYDLQTNNNWTWDTFLDLCRRLTRDTDEDGVTDIYAIHCDDAREFIKGLIYGNGGNFVTFDAQGRATSAVNSPAVIEALNFYNQLINEGLVMTTPEYYWGQNWEAFYHQQVAMTVDPEWRKGQVDFNNGYVLPPRGPRSAQLRMDAIDDVYVIPNLFTAEEVDVILKAAEMWFSPIHTDWFSGHYWASSNFRDVTDTVVMSRDVRYLTPRDFVLILDYPPLFDEFIIEFRDGRGSIDPSQILEAWMPRFNAVIDDFNR